MDSPGEVTEHTDRFGMTPELRVAVQGQESSSSGVSEGTHD